MNKSQPILFGTYGIMNDKPCKLKFDKHGNPNIDVASLYPSITMHIDGSRIVDQYYTEEEGWVIEI